MITKKALKNYLTNGGATLQADGTQAHFSRGYQVAGIAAVDVVPVADFNAIFESVKNCLNACASFELCGLWIDSGLVYIEKSEHVKSLSEAMKKGIERGERYIYDWTLDRCIVTND